MSDPRDNEDSEQDLPELSDDDPLDDEDDEETEDDEFPPLIDTPAAPPGSHFHAEAAFAGNSGFLDAPLVDTSSEPITPGGNEIPSGLQVSTEAPVGNNTENNSRSDGALDAEAEEKGRPRIMKLENGGELLEVEAKVEAALLGDNVLSGVAVKQEEGFNQSHPPSPNFLEGADSGSEGEQSAFMKELERFHKERSLEFKPPKFYGEGLNCLKLWRAVARLGGYERVTSCKLWRQVGESFRPPKTCTTVSWTFRIFYEKALLEYEKHKVRTGELQVPMPSLSESMSDKKIGGNQLSGSGRARRDAAARAMQGWHSQRYLGNGEVGDPIIKDKNPSSPLKRDKHLKSIGGALKRKKPSSLERVAKVARTKSIKTQDDSMVVDIGEPADWVKINVRRIKDCFEVYALVPGLLREEVHVQSDPCGRLIISGEPEQPDNPWGVTPFKKVITLTSRIDPHQTSAVVTLHGQLFVRAPFEQSDL